MSEFPGRVVLVETGRLFALGLDVAVATFRRPFQVREFVEQAWFVTKVSALPTALFTIPFGATIALLLSELTRQFGAQSQTGAGSVVAIVQQAAPIVTALLIAGPAGRGRSGANASTGRSSPSAWRHPRTRRATSSRSATSSVLRSLAP